MRSGPEVWLERRLPRYYFNMRKDSHVPDTVGVELSDADAARREAIRCLGEEMRDNPEQLWNDEEWYLEVSDASGLILFTTYSAAHSSAAGGAKDQKA